MSLRSTLIIIHLKRFVNILLIFVKKRHLRKKIREKGGSMDKFLTKGRNRGIMASQPT